MFCPNCGSNVPDTERFCPTCGTAMANEQAQQPAGAPAKSFDIKTLLVPIIGVVAVIVVIFLAVTLLGGGGGKGTLNKYLKYTSKDLDFAAADELKLVSDEERFKSYLAEGQSMKDYLLSMYPDEKIESMEEYYEYQAEQYEDNLEYLGEEEEYGDDVTQSYKIVKCDKLKGDAFDDYIKDLEDSQKETEKNGGEVYYDAEDIEAVETYIIEVTTKGSEKKTVSLTAMTMYKVDGEWLVVDN